MFLEPVSKVLAARNGAEVAGQLSGLSPKEARRIGQAARARVLAEHTYDHRVREVEALLSLQRAV